MGDSLNNISYVRTISDGARRADYAGYDPYDGLNSVFLKSSPLYKSEFIRLAWIQLFKRSPLNFRGLTKVPRSFNPKAGALFLLGNIRLYQATQDKVYLDECRTLLAKLRATVITRPKGIAWGYNFDWQAKAFYVPIGVPNAVTSVYIGNALLDYAKVTNDVSVLSLVRSIKDFIMAELIMQDGPQGKLVFAYIPGEKAEVHNASLMAAAFLSRVLDSPEDPGRDFILRAVNFSIEDIGEDGYWPYGTRSHHRWMDNFHTAFNLEALLVIRENLKTTQYDAQIRQVYDFYLSHFFLDDGTPKYYSNKLYPVDIHTIAESIIFLSKVVEEPSGLFSQEDQQRARVLIEKIVCFAVSTFWDKRGYFYFQKEKFWFNKINYLRWSQAWMFYALCSYQGVRDVKGASK